MAPQSSVMVSLPQMVDLALHNPEVGAVNFNILHALLHVIIQQIDLLETKVEFRGNDSERIQNVMAATKPGPTLNLTEYIVTPGKEQRKVVSKKSKLKKAVATAQTSKEEITVEKELRVIEQRKDSKEEPLTNPPAMSAQMSSTSMQTVVLVEPTKDEETGTKTHVSVALSRVHFDNMEDEIEKLKEDIRELKELPANMGLIDALRKAEVDKSSPVLDMFQILTLVKRVEATETGITKLASMLEDLAREQTALQYTPGAVSVAQRASDLQIQTLQSSKTAINAQKMGSLEPRIDQLERRVTSLEEGAAASGGRGGGRKSSGAAKPTAGAGGGGGGGPSGGSAAATAAAVGGGGGGGGGGAVSEGVGGGASGGDGGGASGSPGGGGVSGSPGGGGASGSPGGGFAEANFGGGGFGGQEYAEQYGGDDKETMSRIINLENKFTEYSEHMATMDNVFTQQVSVLQAQFTDLEKEIGEIVERMNMGLPAGDMGVDHDGVRELYNKFLSMQEEMEKVTSTAAKLMEDKDERQMHMDALIEQVELLKTIKADREDLEDALADKADTCAVNRKVSHDQFESACDDLSRSIEDALSKLTNQEQLWQQALDDIQQEIGNKLDKMDLNPLKEFVTNKLKILQERLKALAALKQETEAAGTKSKFLRNVNCISCDKEVVMRKQHDPTTMPPPPALPPTKSMAPYLAYELDALRKQQKCAPHGRNMHHFENALSLKIGGGPDDHICNRYCGGSHTVTTPQQRVTRLGHFLQQWGPESQGIHEGQLRGSDGQWYKTREESMQARKDSEDSDDMPGGYSPSARSRPSMVVQGGILSARIGMKTLGTKLSEAEGRSSVSKSAEPSERRPSGQGKRASTGSKQGVPAATPRGSKDTRRPSKSSPQQAVRKPSKQESPSHTISFKEGGGDAEAPPAEAPASEAPPEEAAPPAENEAAEAAPSEAEPPGDAPPPEGEGEAPAEEAAD